jgi:hypothetical protein
MRIESFYRGDSCPVCPVCHGRHYPATNGAGRRVHCDGSPAETKAEQREREARTAACEAAQAQAEREERHAARAEAARKAADTRQRNAAQRRLRAEHAARAFERADAAPLDPAIDAARIPDTFGRID